MAFPIEFLLILSGLFNAGLLSILFVILWSISPIPKSIFAAAVSLWPAPTIERGYNLILPLFMVLKWRWTTPACIGDIEAAKETTDCGNRPLDAGNCKDLKKAQTFGQAFKISNAYLKGKWDDN